MKYKVSDRWYFINTFIIYQLLSMIPMLYPYLRNFSKIFLLWGTIIIIFSLLKNYRHKDIKLNKYLIFFLLWYFIVIIYRDNFIENFKNYYYFIIQVVVIFGFFQEENITKNKKSFLFLIKAIILITFIFSILSLGMYLCKYEKVFINNGTAYNLGYMEGRLSGVYGNTNFMGILAGISFFFSIALCKTNSFYKLNCIIQLLCISLSYSRGSILAIIFAFTYALYSLLLSRYKNTLSKLLLFSLCIPIMVCMYWSINFAGKIGQDIYAKLPQQIQYSKSENSSSEIATSTSTEKYRGSQTNSARLELLVLGVKVFKDHPLMGVGIMNIGKCTGPHLTERSIYTVDNPILNNPHNTPVQILAASGLIGFSIILFFAASYLKKLFQCFQKNSNSVFYTYLLALELMLLANSLFEWYIFLNSSVIASVFWLVSGELLIFSPQKDTERINSYE